jgi:hypothetical protein
VERITFPDGGWIELREPAEVSERLRRPHLAAVAVVMGTEPNTAARVNAVRYANETAAVALIGAWCWGDPITTDRMLDLPSLVYDQILAAIEPKAAGLRWSLVGEDPTDPKADTDDSPSSKPGWPSPTAPA